MQYYIVTAQQTIGNTNFAIYKKKIIQEIDNTFEEIRTISCYMENLNEQNNTSTQRIIDFSEKGVILLEELKSKLR